jgi:hypothetical protein
MREGGPHPALVLGVLTALVLSAWVATTDPFTPGADTVTAIAIAMLAFVVALRWREALTVSALDTPSGRLRWWPWLMLLAALVAWELVSYAGAPRVDHPTVSSLYDSATRWRPVKGVLFLGWLGLGAALVRA